MNPGLDQTKANGEDRAAFTLIELVVVIGTLMVMAMLILPALAGTQLNSQALQCVNNQRQIINACHMYADDNNDLLAPNDWYSGLPVPPPIYRGPPNNWNWVGGGMENVPGNNQVTNTLYLVQLAALGPYNRDARTYHCPADTSTVSGLGPRVRSVSMNAAIGTAWNSGISSSYPKGSALGPTFLKGIWVGPGAPGNTSIWQTYDKLSSLARPSPANLFVIADENPTSINDPTFFMAMGTVADVNGNATSTQFIDTPGSYHNGAGTFAFADGRVETHRWTGSRIKLGGNNYPAGDSLDDLRWLQLRTTALK